MKFNVTTPIIEDYESLNAYFVTVNIMHGDGDGYGSFVAGPFRKGQHEAHLENFLETLELMDSRYPDGRGGGDMYCTVLGFGPWFSEVTEAEANRDFAKVSPLITDEKERRDLYDVALRLANEILLDVNWPSDLSYGESEATYVDHEVWFIDEEKVKRRVEVER